MTPNGNAVTRHFHMALNVRGALKNWRARDFRGLFQDDRGRTLSPAEAKDELLDQLEQGRKVIPLCRVEDCPDFDYSGKGCPGHAVGQGAPAP